MPLFKRKGSSTNHKKLQLQIHLACHNPDDVFDISDCELSKVPKSIYEECKLLHKKKLYMQDNRLTTIISKELRLSDISAITVLDISNNQIKQLPATLRDLSSLQHLNISYNRLTSLPEDIGSLKHLEHLLLRGNQVAELPPSIGDLVCLQQLDIRENRTYTLPAELGRLCRHLLTLDLDVNLMNNPPAVVCEDGIHEIMQFLCTNLGIDYQPSDSTIHDNNDNDVTKVTTSVYYKLEENTRELERKMEEDSRRHIKQQEEAVRQRDDALRCLKINNEELNAKLDKEMDKKAIDKQMLHKELYKAEEHSSNFLRNIMQTAHQNNSSDKLLQCIEEDRKNLLNSFLKQQDLRFDDVLVSIGQSMKSSNLLKDFASKRLEDRDFINETTLTRLSDEKSELDNVLNETDKQKKNLMNYLLKKEDAQKEAFHVLMLERDDKLTELDKQIQILEVGLTNLSIIEIKHKKDSEFSNSEILDTNRRSMAALMVTFIEERRKRNEQIIEILNEMESEKDKTQADYWLHRYQYLMDTKPEYIIDITNQSDYSIVKLLKRLEAEYLIAVFAIHQITMDNLHLLTDEKLRMMGVHQVGLRLSILEEIRALITQRDNQNADIKLRLNNDQNESYIVRPPKNVDDICEPCAIASAPLPPSPSAPTANITAFGIESECSICFERTSCVIFLPCGHICTCKGCSKKLSLCPLCRADIKSRVYLAGSQ